MEAAEQLKRCCEFLEGYKAQLVEMVRKGKLFFVFDFSELMKFDHELAEMILEQPEEGIKCMELAIGELEIAKKFRVRFCNLPSSQNIMIRNIRSEHISKLFQIEGIVRQKSDVRPQVTNARFECPSCGNVISILQLDTAFREPSRCACGRKGKFRLLAKELVDAQNLVLEEVPELLEGGEQPKRINIFLQDDLVSPMSERRTNPGSRIVVVGIVKEVPIILRTGIKSTRFDLMIEANSVSAIEEDFYEIEVSKEEEKQIRDIAADVRVYRRLINSIAPSIYGYDKVKEALLMQLLGGVRKVRKDGVVTRGDIHILLVGDPGAGKSAILRRTVLIAPKARYTSGKGTSAAGITASVVRDEFLKGWSLEAGAMVLANNGLVAIDEMDKMNAEDRAALHEAMENQTVSISKANIQATLLARTTVLGAANPKLGRFDPMGVLAEQIDMPPTLINRFDLIFPIKDLPDRENDEKMAGHMLGLHKTPDVDEPEIPTKLLRKYIAYARRINPQLTDGALEEIKKYYVDLRNSGYEGGAARAVPISPRQLEALIRLSEANARARLSDKVTRKDAKRAVDLLHYCLTQIGLDKETGKIDIDKISTGITSSQRNKIVAVREIIIELENKIGNMIPFEDVVKEGLAKGLKEEDIDDAIEKLRRTGDLFEPKRGFIQRI